MRVVRYSSEWGAPVAGDLVSRTSVQYGILKTARARRMARRSSSDIAIEPHAK